MKRVLLAAAVSSLLASPGAAEVVERIVAKVNRDIITLTELEDMVDAALGESGKERRQEQGLEERKKLAEQVLERMITDRLIVQAGKTQGLKATDSEVEPHVDRELDTVRAGFNSTKEFTAQLKREGISLAELRVRYRVQMRDRFIYLKMVGRKQRELAATIEIPDAEVEKHYAANRDKEEWRMPPRIRARHIQVSVDRDPDLKGKKKEAALRTARERLEAARAALKRGEEFGEVAKSFSDDFTTREKGGDLGVFPRGTYHETMEKAAFGLKEGELSGNVTSPVGLHIIQVTEKLPSRPRELNDLFLPAPAAPVPGVPAPEEKELREHIRDVLLNEKLSGEFQTWVDSLKRKALIQRFLKGSGAAEAVPATGETVPVDGEDAGG